MKTIPVFLILSIIAINTYSQDNFYVKIKGNSSITCGDSVILESELVTPVNLSITLFMEVEDFIKYQIVNNETKEIIEVLKWNFSSSFDTTFSLIEGIYTFKWLEGCANCTNPEIEGKSSEWRIVDGYVECDFIVDPLANPDSISYSWTPIVSDSNRIIIAPEETTKYKVIADHTNGNSAIDSITVSVNPLEALAESLEVSCGEIVQLHVKNNSNDTNALIYNWIPAEYLNDATVSNPIANLSGPMDFKVVVSTLNGCRDSTIQSVEFTALDYEPEICMVSVDSMNQNMILWNKLDNIDFDSVLIYKETSQANVYEKIGIHPLNEKSIFIDNQSNPAQSANRYKIGLMDTCGYVTRQSDFHKTIHLTINTGIGGAWNLIWDKYEGFSYSTINIYRGTTDNILLKIAEQPSNSFSYTDLTPPVGTIYYQIEIENPNPCSIGDLKSSNGYYGSTRSNIVNSDQTISISDFYHKSIEIWPNPVKDKLVIRLNKDLTDSNLSIFSLDGKVLIRKRIDKLNSEINISHLCSGMYLLRLSNEVHSMTMKFVKR